MAERSWYCWLRGENRGGWAVGPGPGDAEVAICRTEEVARLIAAAPDLLAACQQAEVLAMAACLVPEMKLADEVLRNLRAALARATGQPFP